MYPLPGFFGSISSTRDYFFKNFIIKANANSGRIPLYSLFIALMTPFPVMAFINEEAAGRINVGAIDAIIAQSNHVSLFQ